MSMPREVIPGAFYLLTRRCTQRQFLLRPDNATNNAYLYCLLEAADRFGIGLMMMCAMSNHYHAVVHDPLGRYPEFIEHFHKMFARSQNALRRRWENFWSSQQASVVQLVTREAVIDELVYTATNPVKDGLVERVHHWPGVNGLAALLFGKVLRATRPWHFFRSDGPMPEQVEAQLSIPECLGPATVFIGEVRERVCLVEAKMAAERVKTHRKVLGRRGVLDQSWHDKPAGFERRRVLSPRVAARNTWARVEALLRNRAFLNAYAKARAAWLEGLETVFPVVTYWLRRFANVPIAST
jgi:putative transposase